MWLLQAASYSSARKKYVDTGVIPQDVFEELSDFGACFGGDYEAEPVLFGRLIGGCLDFDLIATFEDMLDGYILSIDTS